MTKKKDKLQMLFFALISFIISAGIMTIAFYKNGVHLYGEHGDKQILVVDLWHQYYPFFRVVREKLLTGGSFLYSWENGMGTNFLSLISYYASSPLNWISVFFNDDSVREALTFILIAKIGFSGAFFSLFLGYTFKRKDLSITVFGILFALCSYTLGYYWNVMWFDTIALFPLVMMGITAICREGKWKLFTISLALSLISNYYIGYFTCLFSVIAFAVMAICNCKGVKDCLYKLWITARSALIGIALGGFILLPAYYGLQMTYSANNSFPKDKTFYEAWTDIFANMLSFSPPSTKEGLPNFACGMLAVVLFGVFVFAPKIRIREKISSVLVLGFITVSCNLNILNYIWHGFHFTNMIPYRFAFIFSFVLLVSAYRAYDIIMENGIKIYQLVMMIIFPAVIFYLNYRKDNEIIKNMPDNFKYSIVIAGVFLFIFIISKFISVELKKIYCYIMSFLLLCGTCAETYFNANIGVKTVETTSYSYPTNYEKVEALLSMIDENETDLFYRTESTSTYTLNDSALYGYNGISQFSSAANVSITKFLSKIGLYGSEAGNRFMYRTSGPSTNALLGIKYIISKGGQQKSDTTFLDYYGVSGSAYLYKNKYSLPLGYMMNEDILSLGSDIMDTSNHNIPFEYQNAIFKYATGIEEDLYTPQPVAVANHQSVYVTKLQYGSYNYNIKQGEEANAKMSFEYTAPENSVLYGYVSNNFKNAIVRKDNETIDGNIDVSDYPVMFPMGSIEAGKNVSLDLTMNSENANGVATVVVYAMNIDNFENIYQKLADEPFEITEFKDTNIKGNINVLEDGVMYLSIPYEKGWKVYVDGKKQELVKVMDAMSGVKLEAGQHEVELKYIPEGFVLGVTLTSISVVLFILITVLERKKHKKMVVVSVSSESEKDIKSEENISDNISVDSDENCENNNNKSGEKNEKS